MSNMFIEQTGVAKYIFFRYTKRYMKVCLITNLYPPYVRGGAEQVVAKTVRALRSEGHTVVVITSTPEKAEKIEENGVLIYRLHPKNVFFYTDAHKHHALVRLTWHLINMFHWGVMQDIKKILDEVKPDIVHTHNLMGLSFLIPHAIKRLGIRHLHTVHDVQLVEPSGIILKQKENSWRYKGFPVKIYSWLTKWLFGSPNVVISPSQFLLKFYHERGFFHASKQVVLRNPLTVDVQEVVKTERMNGPVRFLYLGQIEYHKGILFLLETFLQAKELNAELHIVGDGSCFKEVVDMVREDSRVRVYGRMDRKTLPQLFEKIDMAIVPSLCYENSPTVIFESFAFGVPVLASNIEGVAELIKEGENGITFIAGNAESLQEKMQWAVDNQEIVSQMADIARQSVEGLSADEYMENLVRLYF